jgi:hypothetical protein
MGLCYDMRFGDINGDGLADYFCLNTDGSLSAYLNAGGGDFPAEPIWIPMGIIMTAQGYSNDIVRLADMDSDGRVDYLGIDADGNVRGWRNVGTEKTTVPSWVDMGIIDSGGTMGDVNGICFVNFRSDLPGRPKSKSLLTYTPQVDINGDCISSSFMKSFIPDKS